MRQWNHCPVGSEGNDATRLIPAFGWRVAIVRRGLAHRGHNGPIYTETTMQDKPLTMEKLAELRAEIAALKTVWLPLDQTVQCAVCGWHDWQTEEKHSDECPIGFMANKVAAKDAEIERLRAENEGMRKALADVPDPAAFMAAVDALLSLPNVDNRISMWTAEIEAFQLLRATRGKRP